MRIDIITALPRLLESPLGDSIVKRAIEKNLVDIQIHDLRAYSKSPSKQIDDYAYGGGAGMVLMPEPLIACIDDLSSALKYDEIIFMTPDGRKLKQSEANELSLLQNIMIIAGHYKGIDERIREKYVTREISIGDYVLSGGELPAAVLTDAIVRLVPGVLNDETSALSDSFQDGLLAPPVYTRPAEINGMKVPEILLSGNEKAIQEWRFDKAVERTRQRRPDLLGPDR
jgi:tRNA (guanine37-N1)-methyltransferase